MNLETRKPGIELGNTELTDRIIAAGIRVHKELGPGFLEIMYEEALAIELANAGISFERQKLLPVFYREHLIGEHRVDLVIDQKVIVELKAHRGIGRHSFRYCSFVLEGCRLSRRVVTQFCRHTLGSKTRRSRVQSKSRS